MFNLAVSFIAAALLAPSAALGQDSADCVTNCTTLALPAGGCTALTDLTCVCSSQDFLTSASACITQDCPDQLTAAIAAQTAACAAVSGNSTDTGTVPNATDTATTPVVGATTTGVGLTTTRAPGTTTTHPATTSHTTSSTPTTSTGAGFHTASIASGVTLALFGAAFSLF